MHIDERYTQAVMVKYPHDKPTRTDTDRRGSSDRNDLGYLLLFGDKHFHEIIATASKIDRCRNVCDLDWRDALRIHLLHDELGCVR